MALSCSVEGKRRGESNNKRDCFQCVGGAKGDVDNVEEADNVELEVELELVALVCSL